MHGVDHLVVQRTSFCVTFEFALRCQLRAKKCPKARRREKQSNTPDHASLHALTIECLAVRLPKPNHQKALLLTICLIIDAGSERIPTSSATDRHAIAQPRRHLLAAILIANGVPSEDTIAGAGSANYRTMFWQTLIR